MEKPPECLNIDYKLKHKELFSKIMNQLNNYRLKTVFLETLDDDDDEFSVIEWRRIQSVNSTPYEILCLIHNDRNTRHNDRNTRHNSWRRPYGGLL